MKSGLWYSFGLVTASVAVVVWKLWAKPWARYAFSRGDS